MLLNLGFKFKIQNQESALSRIIEILQPAKLKQTAAFSGEQEESKDEGSIKFYNFSQDFQLQGPCELQEIISKIGHDDNQIILSQDVSHLLEDFELQIALIREVKSLIAQAITCNQTDSSDCVELIREEFSRLCTPINNEDERKLANMVFDKLAKEISLSNFNQEVSYQGSKQLLLEISTFLVMTLNIRSSISCLVDILRKKDLALKNEYDIIAQRIRKVNLDQILRDFDNSIEEMRNRDLHPALALAKNKKNLKIIDAYYDQNKLVKWRNLQEKNFLTLLKKVDNLGQQIEAYQMESGKIANYLQFCSELLSFLEEEKDANLQDEEKLQSIRERLLEYLHQHTLMAGDFTSNFIAMASAHAPFQNVLNKLNHDSKQSSSDIVQIQTPKHFLDSYEDILKEINRRNIYNDLISGYAEAKVQEINDIIQREKNLRKEFMIKHGSIIPKTELFPDLLYFKPKPLTLYQQVKNYPPIYDWIAKGYAQTPAEYIHAVKNFDKISEGLPSKLSKHNSENLTPSTAEESKHQLTQRGRSSSNSHGSKQSSFKISESEEYLALHKKYQGMKSKLKEKCAKIKKSLANQTKINLSLQERIKDLSEQYALDISQNFNAQGLSNRENDETSQQKKLYHILAQVCQTNFQLISDLRMQITFGGKSLPLVQQHVTTIKTLEKEKQEIDSQLKAKTIEIEKMSKELERLQNQSPRITKQDHLNYINKIHEFNKAEIDKLQKERNDSILNLKQVLDKYDHCKKANQMLEDKLHSEKEQRIEVLNQLQYKQIELERQKEDFQLRLKETKKIYEDKISLLQRQLLEKDEETDQQLSQVREQQERITQLRKEFEEQKKAFERKLVERKQESENMKSQMEKQIREYSEREREFNRVIKDSQAIEKSNYELKLKNETLLTQIEQIKCQLSNAQIVKEKLQSEINEKNEEIRVLSQQDQQNEAQIDKQTQEISAMSKKQAELVKRIQELDGRFARKLEITIQEFKAKLKSQQDVVQEYQKNLEEAQSKIMDLQQELLRQEVRIEQNLDMKEQSSQTDQDEEMNQLADSLANLEQANRNLSQDLQIVQDSHLQTIKQIELTNRQELGRIMNGMVSVEGLQRGLLYIFMPQVPGVFVCLNDHAPYNNEGYLEEEEKASTISKAQTNKTSKLFERKTNQWRYLLDLQSLDQRTNQILSEFCFIVIGELIETYKGEFDTDILKQSEQDQEEEEDLEFDSAKIEVEYCKVKVKKLVTIQDLEVAVYKFFN